MLEREYSHKKEEKWQIERSKRLSIVEGSAYSVSEGFGLRYITPFALKIGANNFHIGILNSLPSVIGDISEIFTIKAMEKIPRKKICTYGALAQALSWLPLIVIALLSLLNVCTESLPLLLIAFYSILVLFGALISPAWNSWMKDLVSKDERGVYFGKRNTIVTAVVLIAAMLAGFILDSFEVKVLGFAVLFGIAFAARLVSAYLFTKKYEPKFKQDREYYFSFFDFVRRAPGNAFGNFVIFFSLITFSVSVASPFFAVYMLKELKFNYTSFMAVSVASTISTIVFMGWWGKEIDRKGTVKIMQQCGALIFLIPTLWVLSLFVPADLLLPYLFLVELFSGYVWAGFNLAANNYIFDTVSRQRIAICTTYFNIITSIAALFGASAGGAISSIFTSIAGIDSILFIFILSAVLRLAIYIFMIGKVREVGKEIKKI